MITYTLATIWGYVTVGVLITVGIIGFIIGMGGADFFIAPRDNWSKSKADVSGQKFNIGCVWAIVFMVITGWLIVKIFS